MTHLIKGFLTLIIFWNTPVFALGLGNETLHSTLGQKLVIEMPISGIHQIDQDLLRFSVADIDVYEIMDVEFRREHQSLKLSIMPNTDGNLTLLITSSKSIREPFLDFIVNMNTPMGQLFKEVSVLIDTPTPIATTDLAATTDLIASHN